MREHLGRTLLIVVVLLVAAVNIYPTIAWYSKPADEQAQITERIREREIELKREGAGTLEKAEFGVERWSWGDPDMTINLGLDLQGGVLMVIGIDTSNPDIKEEIKQRDLTEEQVRDIVLANITNRIGEFETREPVIQALGSNQVQIQLPGQKDIQRAKELITRTAHLGFHMVAGPEETTQVFRDIDRATNNRFVPFLEPPAERGGPFVVPTENLDVVKRAIAEAESVIPENMTIAFSPPPKPWEEDRYYIYLMDAEERMSGEGLTSAVARPDDRHPGYWLIIFEFGSEAARQFAELTEANIGRAMAIVVDGNVVSAPTIQSRIFDTGNITGNFTAEEAKDLAIALNSGSLPVPVTEEQAVIVGPSLGRAAVNSGVVASLVGLAVVIVFMVLWYRAAGLIADISLLANAIIIIGAFAYFDIILTLPGIAGLILTIGMAVDANVLIFERIREEQATGKSLANCIDAGFEHATSAILDANVTTLIAAAVLTQFGTGPVQGFAIALSIGVVSSVFAALVVSRALMDFVSEHKWISKLSMAEIIPISPNFDFMGKRRIAITASILAIIAGVVVFGIRGGDNFGVDFRTGTNARVQIHADEPVSDGDVRNLLASAGFGEPIVQSYEDENVAGGNTFLIRVGEGGDEGGRGPGEDISTQLQRTLAPLSSNPSSANLAEQVELLSVESVGPAVGAQLREDAVNAILFALMFIVVYLWFRFELKFAVGAVVALAHDVLIVTGLLAIFGEKITLPVIAALLTIIGYSLNDTIVVFDRIREDLATNRARGLSFIENLNLSINRTLSRTLLTSATTVFVVIILYVFGGEAIKPFAFALTAGIVVGTYSSIYIATPVVYLWQQARDRRQARLAESGKGARRRKAKTA